MKYFTFFYFLYLFFVVTFLTESGKTQDAHNGFKRLWPLYTTKRPTLTLQCNITHHATDRTTNISVDWIPRMPYFMMDDYYSDTEKRKLHFKIKVRTKPPTVRVIKDNHGASTPKVPKWNYPTILAFTSRTTTHKSKPPQVYLRAFSDVYIDDDAFYGNLNQYRAKFRGTTVFRKLLPTISSLESSTSIKRFSSADLTEGVETIFAPRTETQPDVTKEATNSDVDIDRIISALKRNTTYTPERRFRYRSDNTYANISCYVCGLDETDINTDGIPRSPSCYHNFDSADNRYKFRSRRLRRACHNDLDGKKQKTNSLQNRRWYGDIYRKGCFRRYTDIGIEYDERGCRTMPPINGFSYASHRYAKLEKTLKLVDEGCVFSPAASLTPFSRAISLYVRYHVCVCQGKWCNRASELRISRVIIFVLGTLYFL